MTVAVLYDELFLEHRDPFRPHPECPERLEAIHRAMVAAKLPQRVEMRRPRPATDEELVRIHRAEYIDHLRDSLPGESGQLDMDTFYAPRSFEAALAAAGGTIDLVSDAVDPGTAVQRGFALVRPPGHHAEANRAMGFCLLNNVALGAEAALAQGAKKVAIVDWDVHHGNGTSHSFYDRDDVLFLSVHRYPFYPGSGGPEETGRGEGRGYTVHAPMASGLGDADFLAVFDDVFVPVIRQFSPDILLISAGFDAHEDDPLGDMAVTDWGYGQAARRLCQLADDLCEGRVVAVLEGGYNQQALARNCVGVTEVLLAEGQMDPDEPRGKIEPYTERMLEGLKQQLSHQWQF